MDEPCSDMNEILEAAALRDLEAGHKLSDHRMTQAIRAMDRRTKRMMSEALRALAFKLEGFVDAPEVPDETQQAFAHCAAYLVKLAAA